MASFISIPSDNGEPDYDGISHNYITNEVQEQHQFENIPEVGLCLKRLIDNIQAEANRLASDDPKNSEVHNINGINACNLVEQYIAMTVFYRESKLFFLLLVVFKNSAIKIEFFFFVFVFFVFFLGKLFYWE